MSAPAERYGVCVDISAKLEAWDKPSMIAVANGHTRVLRVAPEVKQAAARLLGSSSPPQYPLMAALAFLALRPEIHRLSSVTLDQDYSGEVAERIITRRLVELIHGERPRFKASAVRIGNVAGSRADRLARAAYKKVRQPDGEITLEELAAVL